MQYTWQLALVLVPVYFIKHSVSCLYILSGTDQNSMASTTGKLFIASYSYNDIVYMHGGMSSQQLVYDHNFILHMLIR